MKKILTLVSMTAALLAGINSCEEPQTGYEGTNYIFLETGTASMYDTPDASMGVTVRLTTSLDRDLVLSFSVNDTEGIITLEGNPVTIPAGSTTGAFTIRTAEIEDNSRTFRITLDEDTVLPENITWSGDFTFTVNSSKVPELTEEQLAIVEAYKNASGIDLSKYLGIVSVSTVYTASSQDSDIPLPAVTITGVSVITLSEQSTQEQPVLKMTGNPMGLQETFYDKLKDNTLNNPYWADTEYAPSYSKLLETIGWTSASEETFTATLDGIRPQADGTVEFVADMSYYDEEWDEQVDMFKVPFEFTFSAYEREKAAIEKGEIGSDADPDWLYDATVNPDFFLNCDNIAEDYYESGNWIKSGATISDEKLTFTFCVYNYNEYDYSRAVVTYTPNN